MRVLGRIFSIALLAGPLAGVPAALAQRPDNLKPSESIWKPAAAPPGGISWTTLESTKEVQRRQSGTIYSKPDFSTRIEALKGKRIKVSGYVMPLQNTAKQTHFVLLAYPPDCPFHLNPAPNQFIEIKTASPISVRSGVQSFEGQLVLGGQDESGIFYTMLDSREL
ncbi:hypothetical protein J2W40_001630 [Sphingobium xenophagum]|uniref:DUF3299 domain-containing protein n=1 Tax=Sphingobium xenophagum TaxID=121428 RepID=A0ABU1WZR4_SPHXE|nr:DUF3299 domain-containing protein [Sphingobium xenophagum]MDR7154815.1 hypothetical protein [Sphingobium xenophagum]